MSKRKKPAYSGGLVLEPKKGQSIGDVTCSKYDKQKMIVCNH